MRVIGFQPAQRSDFTDTLENAKLNSKYLDWFVVIEDSSKYHAFTPEQRREIEDAGADRNNNVVVIQHPYEDDHPKMYQWGVDKAKELGADWLVHQDADEHLSELFLKNVHDICKRGDEMGIDMLGVRCRAQFSIADAVWPSSLSVDVDPTVVDLTKYPDDIVETNDHKHMLMKGYPDLVWGGAGRTKNVHTTWGSPSHPWNAANLQPEMWYLHRKTPLQVYSSAARNMFVSGGGANLGDINDMWVELKAIMKDLEVKTWPELERFVQSDDDAGQWAPYHHTPQIAKLIDWIARALTWKATDYGTETRQTALWMIFWHRDLLDVPAITAGIKNPPKVDEAVRLERFVQSKYVEVLQRWPDKQGLDSYIRKIKSGELEGRDLDAALRESSEYREKRDLTDKIAGGGGGGGDKGKKEEEEVVRIPLPVTAEVRWTEDLMMQTIMSSKMFRERMRPRYDLGKALEDVLMSGKEDAKEFYREFYESRETGDLFTPATMYQLLSRYMGQKDMAELIKMVDSGMVTLGRALTR